MPNKNPDPSAHRYSQGSFSGRKQSGTSPSYSDRDLADLSQSMLIKLGEAIENDVVPRLMLSVKTLDRARDNAHDRPPIHSETVDEFVHLVLYHDAPVATNYVSTLRSSGVPLAAIYLDLLTPAAHRLGEMWTSDECTFTDVTIGVCRMHQVLLQFSRCFDSTASDTRDMRNILVMPAHGEQHTFGLLMVMEFLRRNGWDCFSGTPATMRDFKTLVDAQRYGAIGISVSAERHIQRATDQVSWIRQRSRNRRTVILVGGYAILQDPGLVKKIGADATAADGQEAATVMSRYVAEAEPKSAM